MTLCNAVDFSTPGFIVLHYLWSLLKHTSIESLMPSNNFILCLFCLLLPSLFPSIRVLSNELALLIRWPILELQLQHQSLLNIQGWFPLEYTAFISLLSKALSRKPVSGFQHHNLKASVFWCSALFMVQLSYPHTTTRKTIIWVDRPLPAKWCLWFLICSLSLYSFSSLEQVSFNFMAAVNISSDVGALENKVCPCFHIFPIICLEWWDQTHDSSLFLDVEF